MYWELQGCCSIQSYESSYVQYYSHISLHYSHMSMIMNMRDDVIKLFVLIQVFAKHYSELKKVFTKEVTANTKWGLSDSHLFLPIKNPYLCPQVTETKIPTREGRGFHYNDSWCLSSFSGLSKWRGSPAASCYPRHFLCVPTPKPLNYPMIVYQLSSHDRKACCREWTSWLKQHFTFSPGTGEQVWEKNDRSRHELHGSRKNKV